MILEQIPVINPLTSSKVWEGFLEVDHRHKAFRTLAATSRRLRAIFYEQSWETRALTQMELPMMPGFFKQPEGQAVAPHVRCVFSSCLNYWAYLWLYGNLTPILFFYPLQEIGRRPAERFYKLSEGVFTGSPFPIHVRNRGHHLFHYWIGEKRLQGET